MRTYNLIDRLRRKNERPIIAIDEEHQYKVNTSKTNVLLIMHEIKQSEKKDDYEDSYKLSDVIIKLALGKDALNYVNSLNPTNAFTLTLTNAIMAAMNDVDLEDDDEQDEEKGKKEKK